MRTPRQIQDGDPVLRKRRLALAKLIDAGNVLHLASLDRANSRNWEAALAEWEFIAANTKEPSR